LKHLAKSLGFVVIPGNRNTCRIAFKIITINFRQKIDKQVWALAHEIGHAKTLDDCAEELGSCVFVGPEHSWESQETEWRAWAVADKLMKKFALYTDDYLRYKHSCLSTYYYK